MEKNIYNIHNFLAGEISKEESEKLQVWLSEKEENQALFQKVQFIWKESAAIGKEYDADYVPDTEKALSKVRFKINPPDAAKKKSLKVRSVNRRQWMSVAASFLVLVAIGWWWSNQDVKLKWQETIAQSGSLKELILEDGTKVWLNKNAKLSYPEIFSKKKRVVRLEGEAYFEVSPNPEKQFIIESQQTQVRVLGTKFNYKSSTTNSAAEVQVLEGKVLFGERNQKSGSKGIILTKNQKGVFNSLNKELKKEQIYAENAIFWKTGRLVFDGMKVTEVAEWLELFYNIKINLKDSKINNCLFTSDFDHDELTTVFELFEVAYQIKVKETGYNTFDWIGGNCK